jgi:hypothetical protein
MKAKGKNVKFSFPNNDFFEPPDRSIAQTARNDIRTK